MANSSEELIQVSVPKRHLGAVYRLIGELEAGGSETSASVIGEEMIRGWTPDLIRRAYDESGTPMRAVLNHLADHAGQDVPSKDLETALEQATGESVGPNTLPGTLGAFGRRVASRYGLRNERGGAILPWKSRWDPSYGSVVYEMPKDIADVIASR